MGEIKHKRAKSEPTETVFLRVPRSVSKEFRAQAAAENRKLAGHFTALVEAAKSKAA